MPLEGDLAPGQRWKFDADVAKAFDDMLERSVPQHDAMRQLVFDVADRYVQPGLDVVDLGCSRGEAMARFVREHGAHNRHVGLEVSAPMLEAARARFEGYINAGVVDVREHDLRKGYPSVRSCVTLSVLTLQFVPVEHRQRVVRDVFKSLVSGGAFVLVEKVLGATADLDRAFVDLHHVLKAANGYSRDEIERKRLSLEGVLVPLTARMNEELLRDAGFREVDCFWRALNFAGWIAVKGDG